MFTKKNLREDRTFLVIDLGVVRSKILLCSWEQSELSILDTICVTHKRKSIQQGGIFGNPKSIAKDLRGALITLTESYGTIKEVVVCCTSKYLISDTIVHSLVRPDASVPIRQQEVYDMLDRVESLSFDRIEFRAQLQSHISVTDMQLVTTCITFISLDGKIVTNPIGHTAQRIKLGIVNVFGARSYIQALASVCEDAGLKVSAFVPSGIGLVKCTPRRAQNTRNAYIDIGYSHMSVVIQDEGQIIGYQIIPFGMSVLEQELMSHTELHVIEIEELMRHPGKLLRMHSDIVDRYIELMIDGVCVCVEYMETLSRFDMIYLSGGGAPKEFRDSISRMCRTNIHARAEVQFLGDALPENVRESVAAYGVACSGTELVAHTKDPLLSILLSIVYAHE